MGAVNYKTSDYITLGVKPYDEEEIRRDSDFMEEIKEQVKEYGGTESEAIQEVIRAYYEDDYNNISSLLDQHYFYYFHISVEYGYYEGFTLNIENNFPVAFDSWEEKREAQKEITEIKKFLTDCAGSGLVAVFPGWVTAYEDYRGTLREIESAIAEMRQEVRNTPTWKRYNSDCYA